jgi:hypothetical protein
VIVAVDVNVIDPVIVAVHVHVNAPVDVIDAVNEQGPITFVNIAPIRSSRLIPRATTAAVGCVVDGVDHDHGAVPVHVHGLDHGGAHGHGHDHVNGPN